jgi:hypothetical protein
VALAVPLVGAGCLSTKAPERTGVMESIGVQATARRTRLASQGVLQYVLGSVEVTADSIARLSDDPRVRYNTLVWKTQAMPAFQLAMLQPDPLVSFTDGWTLLVQMRAYFESGGGSDAFGAYQDVAVDALREMETILGARVAENEPLKAAAALRTFVYEWADEHPLTNDQFLRESVRSAVVDVLAQERGGGLSSLGSMAEMAEDAQQMAVLLASYTPKQIAWQSELLMADLADSARVASALGAVDGMELTTAMTEFLQTAPALLASERAAAFREIADERNAVLRDLQRQRIETLDELTRMIAAERAQIAAEIDAQREATVADVQDLTDRTFAHARGLVNHVLLLVGLMGLGLVILVFVGLDVLRRRAR